VTAPLIAARQDALLAWASLGAGVAPRATEVIQGRGRSIVLRLVGAAPGGADVVAQRFGARRGPVERAVHALPLPPEANRPRCWGFVPLDGGVWGFFEAVDGRRYRPEDAADRRLAARWLAALHARSAESGPGTGLPELGAGHWRRLAREARESATALLHSPGSPADAEVLRSLARSLERLTAAWEPLSEAVDALPFCLIHGDFATKNLRVRENGHGSSLVVVDWGEAGWGPPAIDLARGLPGTADPDVETYARGVANRWPALTAERIAEAAEAGTVLRAISGAAWRTDPPQEPFGDHERDELGRYTGAIESWLSRRSR
jgi:hypothetical protein